jgi:hypothetical protein
MLSITPYSANGGRKVCRTRARVRADGRGTQCRDAQGQAGSLPHGSQGVAPGDTPETVVRPTFPADPGGVAQPGIPSGCDPRRTPGPGVSAALRPRLPSPNPPGWIVGGWEVPSDWPPCPATINRAPPAFQPARHRQKCRRYGSGRVPCSLRTCSPAMNHSVGQAFQPAGSPGFHARRRLGRLEGRPNWQTGMSALRIGGSWEAAPNPPS